MLAVLTKLAMLAELTWCGAEVREDKGSGAVDQTVEACHFYVSNKNNGLYCVYIEFSTHLILFNYLMGDFFRY